MQKKTAISNLYNLQETASIKPELTKLDGLDGSENVDRGSQWSQQFDGLEAQAMQKKTAISNLYNLQETASIKPELTKLDGLDGSESVDRGSQWSQQFDGLEAQAMQKKTAISNLCNDRIYWRPRGWSGSTEAFTGRALRAAEKLISKSLIRSSHRKLVFDDNLLSLRSILQSWNEDQAHVVARALRDACDAMFKKNMSASRLHTLIGRYDKIIAILT